MYWDDNLGVESTLLGLCSNSCDTYSLWEIAGRARGAEGSTYHWFCGWFVRTPTFLHELKYDPALLKIW